MKPLRLPAAAVVFGLLMVWLAFAFERSGLVLPPASGFPRVFASFLLLLAPLWFSGFGAIDACKRLPARAQFSWRAAVILIAFPLALAAFLKFSNLPARLTWRDALALGLIVAAYFLEWFESAW